MVDAWNEIADWFAERQRAGSAMHEFARDILFEQLPTELRGLRVLDIGCSQGLLTRAAAERGAKALGIDPAERMIEHALAAEAETPTGAEFAVDDGCALATVGSASKDWVIAGLSLNNVPDLAACLLAVRRVLVPGGGLVAVIPHPCFEAPHASWTGDRDSPRRVVGDYATEGFWRSDNPQGVRRAGNRHRKLSTYVAALIEHGFALEAMTEPAPDEGVVAEQPRRAGLPPFLVLRARPDVNGTAAVAPRA
ncbi:class I SAM-dependent methyltransferase [Glycomyces salinus]|uniref:class I SAM-dependent methyltransferase n=1 Tax=Glycomyces salinus TaxID=980294 RepID=UPI0018EC0804|nr:class I SAM-dependent methyltransferase [Glycomyces salinus]